MNAERESTNIIFLEEAKNLEEDDDLEILEEAPLRVTATLPPLNKGQGASTMSSKIKEGSMAASGDKLIADAQRARASKRLARVEGNTS